MAVEAHVDGVWSGGTELVVDAEGVRVIVGWYVEAEGVRLIVGWYGD